MYREVHEDLSTKVACKSPTEVEFRKRSIELDLHAAILTNEIEFAEKIIKRIQELVIKVDEVLIDGVTPLSKAIKYNKFEMVELLLKYGSDIELAKIGQKDALDFAGEGTPIYNLLLLYITNIAYSSSTSDSDSNSTETLAMIELSFNSILGISPNYWDPES